MQQSLDSAIEQAISAISGFPLVNADGVKLKIDIQKVQMQVESNDYDAIVVNFRQPFQTDDYVILGSAVLSGITVRVLQMDSYSNTHCVWYYETHSETSQTKTLTIFNLAIGY